MKRLLPLFLICFSAVAQPYRYSKEGDIEPWADGIHSLGSPLLRWSALYVRDIHLEQGTNISSFTINGVVDGASGLQLAEAGVIKWGIVNRGGAGDVFQIYADGGLEQDMAFEITQGLQYTLRGSLVTVANTNTWTSTTPFGFRATQFAGNGVGTAPVGEIQFQRETGLADNRRGAIAFKTNNEQADTTEWMRLTSLGGMVGAFKLAQTPSAEQPLLANDQVLVNAGAVRVRGAGGPITLTSLPHILPGSYDNQKLQVECTSDTNPITLTDNDTMPGSGVELNTGTVKILRKYQKIHLSWNAPDSKWTED
jgi:hypothetical protein